MLTTHHIGADLATHAAQAGLAQWTFVAFNLVILGAYVFLATKVAPKLPLSKESRLSFTAFLFLCGVGTHGEMVVHVLFEPMTTQFAMAAEWHMLAIHILQAISAVSFAALFYRDLNRIRDRAATED